MASFLPERGGMMVNIPAELLVSSIALGTLGAWLIGRFAGRLSLLDCPNERSSHSCPTPKGGGVGILAAFLLTGILSGLSAWFWVPISVLSLIAGYGDRVDLTPRLRLGVQFGLIAVFVLGTWQPSSSHYSGYLMILFWVVYIAGTANYYNFMDGINGIAGISGVVSFLLLAFFIFNDGGESALITLSLCMAFSCLGFLPLNMPTAKVFMGDVGSILLGTVFAGLVYLESHTFLDFVCMASFLFPFYADELSTMVVRLKDGENLTEAHRRHIYQLLANERHIAHWIVSIGYGVMQVLVGVCVLLAKPYGVKGVLVVLAGWLALFVVIGYYIRAGVKRIDCGIVYPDRRRRT